jgi:phospholipid/cholesterol/gamma-HCH transport system ATP-binding protein
MYLDLLNNMKSALQEDISQKKSRSSEPVLSVRQLYKSFSQTSVLQGFDLDLKRGESVVVLGKSGSGKSVLIKCIIGLLKPDRGTIALFGTNVPDLDEDELDRLRSRVGFLFQSNALYDSMTVRENLEFPLRRHWISVTQVEINAMVEEALFNVGLRHTVDMMPAELSGGMKKRIALARTLILKPEIILYDEPTTGLDTITGKEIIELMIEIQKKYNTSSLIISHDMNCVRMISDRVVMLIEGRCYASGTYEQLKRNADPKVRQFFD